MARDNEWGPFEPTGKTTHYGAKEFHVQIKESVSAGGTEQKEFRHPSFGQISVCRWHGATKSRLFESNVDTATGISIEIKHAELKRDLSNNWVYGYDTICEIKLSPAQWAELLVNMNTVGVPCTLDHYWDRTGFVYPVYPEDFDNEMARIEKEFKAAIKELEVYDANDVDAIKEIAAKLPKKDQDKLRAVLDRVNSRLKDHIPFIRDMAEESVQRTVTQAKSEVSNFITLSMNQAGLAHLISQAPTLPDAALPTLSFDDTKDL
jgi:hypothetical protein